MSVTVSKAEPDGVTMVTLTYDSQSAWPPLCQILKSLCWSPVCSTMCKQPSGVQRASQAVLGALQIMVGLLSIGLEVILSCANGRILVPIGCASFPYWSGALFIVFGIKGLFFEKYLIPVILNMILNLAGFVIAMTAIVLYTINITYIRLYTARGHETIDHWCYSAQHPVQHTTPSPSLEKIFLEKCLEGKLLTMMLKQSINLLLIVLSGLEVGITMTAAFLEIKALHQGQNKSTDDPEHYKLLMEEVTAQPTS